MKISRKLNQSIAVKILLSVPLVFLLYFVLLHYNAIGQLSAAWQEPYSLETIVDDWIPFVAWFLLPYGIWFSFPIVGLLLAFRKQITAIKISSMYIAHILLLLTCFVIYLAFPTSAESVMLDTSLFDFSQFPDISRLHAFYEKSVPYNAFPSYHVAPMVFLSIFLYHHWRSSFWLTLPITVSISLATVFIKYHFFVDILGGIAMGIFAYYILYEQIVLRSLNKLRSEK